MTFKIIEPALNKIGIVAIEKTQTLPKKEKETFVLTGSLTWVQYI